MVSGSNATNSATGLQANAGVATVTGSQPGGASGLSRKDATEDPTSPKFGEIYQQIQAKFGAKAEKPREIKKALGKDDFLRIMITQMRHQDPTSPFKPDQMAAQMAQFASVEQLQNVNQNLNRMAQQNSPLERLAMTNMIGKVVTVDRERFPHTEGMVEPLSYVLPKDAASVQVAVIAENGETVFSKDLGPQKAGENSLSWDGTKGNSPLPAKTGTYQLRVEAKDASGVSLNTSRQTQAKIIGVSFEGAEPVFLVGDSRRQEKITLRNVVRVESDGMQPSAPGISSGQQLGAGAPANISPSAAANATGAANEKPANFISFQKGVGSSNLDPNQASPEIREALARYQAQQQQASDAAGAAASIAADGEKGFPNGLQD